MHIQYAYCRYIGDEVIPVHTVLAVGRDDPDYDELLSWCRATGIHVNEYTHEDWHRLFWVEPESEADAVVFALRTGVTTR
jgi:hypothetical protein